MSDTPGSDAPPAPPASWYPAQGDPPGTLRYWDGTQWVGDPVVPAAEPPPPAGPRLASPWGRIGARAIDTVIVAGPTVLVLVGTGYDPANLDEMSGRGLFAVFLITVAAVLYEVGFIATRGATPGKMALGIAVIRPPSPEPPGWGAGFKRWLINLVGGIPIAGPFVSVGVVVVSLVLLFTDGERRTLWDRIAGTRVVAVR